MGVALFKVRREFTDPKDGKRYFPTGLWEGDSPEVEDRIANGEIEPIDREKARNMARILAAQA